MIALKNKPKVKKNKINLKLCFSIFTVHQNHVGSFEQILMPGWTPRDSDLISLGLEPR